MSVTSLLPLSSKGATSTAGGEPPHFASDAFAVDGCGACDDEAVIVLCGRKEGKIDEDRQMSR